MKRFFIFVVLIALLIVGLTRWRASHPLGHRPEKYTPVQSTKIDPGDVKVLAAMDEEYTKVVDAVVPSVVSITTSRRVRVPNNPYLVDPFEEFFGLHRRGPRAGPREGVQNSLGSGVIVSKEGHVITNYHVIANMDDVKVQLNDGRIEPAQLIGSDEETDIAVLKVNARDLVPLPFGDSDQVKVGQLVFAVGNPFGLQETVTQGIISAKGRRATEDSSNDFFQTDTAINPGNSGGPLVNLRGEIIGINAAIYSSSTSQASWQGVGFAIPANTARRALESVLQHGRVQRGYLGVGIQELTPELAQQFGVKERTGALVTEVMPDSPAQKAGLQSGDVITEANGQRVNNIRDLRKRVAEVEIGQKATLKVTRQNKEMTVTAVVAEQPSDVQTSRAPSSRSPLQPAPGPQPGFDVPNVFDGVRVAEIPPGHRSQLPENISGVMVAQIDPDAPAADILQAGDVIEEINHTPIKSVADFEKSARAAKPNEKQMLFICRGRTRSYAVLTPR